MANVAMLAETRKGEMKLLIEIDCDAVDRIHYRGTTAGPQGGRQRLTSSVASVVAGVLQLYVDRLKLGASEERETLLYREKASDTRVGCGNVPASRR